jgi:MFS family permease
VITVSIGVPPLESGSPTEASGKPTDSLRRAAARRGSSAEPFLARDGDSIQGGGKMNKPVFGLLIGGVLGIFDGLTALFYPETRPLIAGIVIGSTFKGVIAGLAIGFFARKVHSLFWGAVFGLAVGLFLAYLVAAMPNPSLQRHYYVEIMVPGAIVGMIVGLATQRFRVKEA